MKLRIPIRGRPPWTRFFIYQWLSKQYCLFIMSMIAILIIFTWTISAQTIMKYNILGHIFSNTQESGYVSKLLLDSYNENKTVLVQESVLNKTSNNQQTLRHQKLSYICG